MKPRIAISMGDPNGIGPEISLKAFDALKDELEVVLVGDRGAFQAHAAVLGRTIDDITLREPGGDAGFGGIPVSFGEIESGAGRRAMEAVRTAVELCRSGEADAMVTAPISKEAITRAGYPFPGHTEYIAHLCGTRNELMVMVAGDLRVALVTIHVSLRSVPPLITRDRVAARIRQFDGSLRRDFGLSAPRIAVLGLNPHAGDGGVIGDEEQRTILPAMSEAASDGVVAEGPFPADGFFGSQSYKRFDGVLAMYHDQGLVPFKTLSFNHGANFTAGLPIVRISPDHGTAFDIAGKGVANAHSLIEAAREAVRIAVRRREFRESSRQAEAAHSE